MGAGKLQADPKINTTGRKCLQLAIDRSLWKNLTPYPTAEVTLFVLKK
jgi:hypothetical protein